MHRQYFSQPVILTKRISAAVTQPTVHRKRIRIFPGGSVEQEVGRSLIITHPSTQILSKQAN